MLSRSDLHDYQNRFVDFIKAKRRCAGWLDMGLGKSVSALTAISDLLDGMAVDRVLVIAPLRVANSVWAQEAAKWEHLHHLRVSVATGPERARIAALSRGADVYVINRENIPWLVKHYGAKWPFDCVVIDEASSFKSASSQRFKALKRILPYTSHMVLLTGTPSPNGLLDIWAQMYLVDFGMTLGRTMTAYKQQFFESDYMGYKFTPRKGAPEQIRNLLGDSVVSMSAADYLELPDRIDLIEHVDLPPAAAKAYAAMEEDMVLEVADDVVIEALSAATLAGKLLQLANGALYEGEGKSHQVIHDAKLDALEQLVESADGEPLLVAYNFKSDLERIKARFPQAVALGKDQQTIDDWNDGKIPMLLAHPASAGMGLNLQRGGSVIVWFGLNWALENYLQFNARLHRQGQSKPVRIIHLAAKGTIDDDVLKVLKGKDASQSKLLAAVSERVRKINASTALQ